MSGQCEYCAARDCKGECTRAELRPKPRTVEICRSFGYKLNVGNYESRDFFCSQKLECSASDAEIVSEGCYEFCKDEVLRSVAAYLRDKRQQEARKSA